MTVPVPLLQLLPEYAGSVPEIACCQRHAAGIAVEQAHAQFILSVRTILLPTADAEIPGVRPAATKLSVSATCTKTTSPLRPSRIIPSKLRTFYSVYQGTVAHFIPTKNTSILSASLISQSTLLCPPFYAFPENRLSLSGLLPACSLISYVSYPGSSVKAVSINAPGKTFCCEKICKTRVLSSFIPMHAIQQRFPVRHNIQRDLG